MHTTKYGYFKHLLIKESYLLISSLNNSWKSVRFNSLTASAKIFWYISKPISAINPLCSPPNKSGELHPAILFAAQLVGITKIYKIGGVQAIAAPLRGEGGNVVAAIGLGTHTSEIGKEIIRDRYLPLLLETARSIESDWNECRKLPTKESALNMDGMQLLHLRRNSI